jgi:PAS domain S-box-containing protein
MPKADLPPNELQRLAALHACGVLDTAPEGDFDDITALAQEICEVPIALVSLVADSRQWFKSCIGLPVRETPRDVAFCAYAILRTEPLVIEDAASDPRTFDNALVTGEPGIRFYAGVPLINADGFALGTLCIIDTKPRSITPQQLQSLVRLARQVTAQLELRRACRELVHQRAAAEARDERYRLLVEQAEVVVWEFDVAANAFTYVSPAAANLGYPLTDWLAPGFWLAHVHPDDRDGAMKYCLSQIESNTSHRFQYRMIAADGRIVWIDDTVSPPVRENGRLLLRGTLADITERLLIEKALRQANEKLNFVIEGAGLGTWDWDVVTGHVSFNERWASMLGYTLSELKPELSTWERLVHPDDRQPVMGELEPHLRNETPTFQCQHRLLAKDGSWKWVLDLGRVIERDNAGNPIRAVGVHVDVTEAKELELKLAAAKAAAEAASRSKSEFLANMSHEIRTPMTAILGYADLLLEDGDLTRAPERRVEAISTIRRNGEHLLSIINDILDLSKIEAGCMTVESVPVNPAVALREVIDLMSVRAEAKGLTLNWTCDTPVPARFNTDPTRLRQILVNLIGNAIKFTEVGGITAAVSFNPASSQLTLAVQDTGIGIPESQIGRLFTAFAQADSSTTRRFGGTGLGLNISRRFAQMLGGDITVTSTPGSGSCFSLAIAAHTGPDTIRLTPAEFAEEYRRRGEARAQAVATSSHATLNGVRILLAEDGPDNVRLFSYYLRKAGAAVTTVSNGREAVQALCANGNEHGPLLQSPPFDLLISDMQMPDMDGYEAAALLRSKGSTLPIVALTAHAMSTDADRCTQAGCDVYGSKPIDAPRLIALCQAAIDARKPRAFAHR